MYRKIAYSNQVLKNIKYGYVFMDFIILIYFKNHLLNYKSIYLLSLKIETILKKF